MGQIRFSAGEDTGGGWTPLPEGTYDFRIIEAEQGVSSNKNPQLRVKLEVLDGPRSGDKTNTWYSLLPQSGWKLRRLIDALEIDYQVEGKDADGNELISFDDEELVQRCVRMDVKQREYNGKTVNDFLNEELSQFDADYGEDEVEEPAQQAAPTPAPAPQQAAGSNGAAVGRGRRRPRPRTETTA